MTACDGFDSKPQRISLQFPHLRRCCSTRRFLCDRPAHPRAFFSRPGKLTSRGEKLLLVFVAAAAATAAIASETISYRYDARGRLVRVERSGSVNANVTANYSYDKADNRTSVNAVSPNAPP
jgi:hypothetical protein